MLKYINGLHGSAYVVLYQGKPIVVGILDGKLLVLAVDNRLKGKQIPWHMCEAETTEINKSLYLSINYNEPNNPPFRAAHQESDNPMKVGTKITTL